MNSAIIIARKRAWGAVGLFTLFGVAGIVFKTEGVAITDLVPQVIAYTALVAQTFFSIRRFSQVLNAAHPWQRVADSALVATYAGMAWAFAWPAAFLFFFTAMFTVAVVKYASHTPRGPEEAVLLHRKTLVDAVGCVACLAAFGLVVISPVGGAWTWAIGFTIATVYVIGPGKLYA